MHWLLFKYSDVIGMVDEVDYSHSQSGSNKAQINLVLKDLGMTIESYALY